MMKKSVIIILVSSAIVFALSHITSCEKYILPNLSLSKDTLSFSAIEDSVNISINSNVMWEFDETGVDWIVVTPNSGDEADTVKVKVFANSEAAERTHTLTITSETISRNLVIIQAAAETETEIQEKQPVETNCF